MEAPEDHILFLLLQSQDNLFDFWSDYNHLLANFRNLLTCTLWPSPFFFS